MSLFSSLISCFFKAGTAVNADVSSRELKEISMEDLYQILGNVHVGELGAENKHLHPYSNGAYDDPEIAEEMLGYLSEKTDDFGKKVFIYDHDAYIRRVKARGQKYGLQIGKHICIEKNPKKIDVEGLKEPYYTKYKITVKNLKISVGTDFDLNYFNDFINTPEFVSGMAPIASNKYKDNLYIVFHSNHFVPRFPDRNCYFMFFLLHNTYMILQDNVFGVEMSLYAGQNALIELINNRFNGKKVTIHGRSEAHLGTRFGSPYGDFSSTKHIIARHFEHWLNEKAEIGNKNLQNAVISIKAKVFSMEEYNASIKDILKILLYMEQKAVVDPSDIETPKADAIVRFIDNVINKLEIFNVNYYFKGTNSIHNLKIDSGIKHLYWGPYQNIDPEGHNPDSHKKMFLHFMERAAKSSDKMQEAYLHREVIKCERALIKSNSFWQSWQDRIILGWSSFVSDYGVSWARPLLLLTAINASLAVYVITDLLDQEFTWATWRLLFAEFFNPLSSLSDVVKEMNSNMTSLPSPSGQPVDNAAKTADPGWLSLINVGQKIILGIFAYEIIKIFRRFSK